MTRLTALQQLEKHYSPEPNTGCWLWTGAVNRKGYGTVRRSGRTSYAHRLAFEEYIGVIPASFEVCHKCDERSCVNPRHLFAASHQENIADCIRKNRQAKGEKKATSKLNIEQVREIRASQSKVADLVKKYGVNDSSIRGIKSGRYWKHVPHIANLA